MNLYLQVQNPKMPEAWNKEIEYFVILILRENLQIKSCEKNVDIAFY